MLRFLQRRGLVADASFTKWPLPSHLDAVIHRSGPFPEASNGSDNVGNTHASPSRGKDKTLGVYAGFDPTAPSLHLGNLTVLMTLARLSMKNANQVSRHEDSSSSLNSSGQTEQTAAHDHEDEPEGTEIPRFQPYIVVGGMTGRIGDPSGKSTERPALHDEAIKENLIGIRSSVDQVFEGVRRHSSLQLKDLDSAQGLEMDGNTKDFHDTQSEREILPPIVVDNSTFYESMYLWEFFGRIGRYFRLSSMLAKDTVASRLSDGAGGMSFAEFSYPLFQAYDFLHLFLTHGCVLQVGGSDQWGNITAGIDLIKRAKLDCSPTAMKDIHQFDPQGFTVPLLTTVSGAKFGKSEGNAVWLDPKLTTNYDLFQYLLNVADDDCEKLLFCLTFLHENEIQKVLRAHFTAPEKRIAQQVLAEYLVHLLRGYEGMREAQTVTNILFGSDVEQLTERDMERAISSEQIPSVRTASSIALTTPLPELLVKAELATSKSEAKRLLKGGGIYINGKKCNDDRTHVKESEVLFERYVMIRVGRKRHCILELSER